MILLLSPAKKMQVQPGTTFKNVTIPEYLPVAEKLVKKLRGFSAARLRELMDINAGIAEQNKARFADWKIPFTSENAAPAVLSFTGDVYVGLDARSLSMKDLAFAQEHLRILSGLYGLLKPLDLIQPYRLEMGTSLGLERHKDLYSLWKKPLNASLRQELGKQKHNCLINLASNEYFSVIDPRILETRIVDISFKEWKNSQWNIFFVNLKRARGMMARFIIENRITQPEDIQGFDTDSYHFNPDLSREDQWVFTR
jgi:uncharacterized protein